LIVGSLVFDLPADLAIHKARVLARAGRPVLVGPLFSRALRPRPVK
jgi:hypothetical protein